MKLHSFFGRTCLLFLSIASLSACSRAIEGEVFLDKNSNNIRDLDESTIPGLRFTVTMNNATKQSGLTDGSGRYWVPMGNDAVGGNYCVQVRSEDVSALKALQNTGAKPVKALEASPEATSEAEEEDACAKTSDGEPDCSDKDCCEKSECSDASACKSESDKDACPKDNAGEPNCNDSRCSKEAACDTYTVKSMQACDESKAAKFSMRLDVPVAMDYATRIASLEAVTIDPVSVGEPFGIEITYPSSCVFQPYILPAGLAPYSLGDAFNPMTHELFLDRAVRNLPWQVITLDVPPFGQDALYTYVLRLQALSKDGLGEKFQIQPSLTCPDGRKVSARPVVIPFKEDTEPVPTEDPNQ